MSNLHVSSLNGSASNLQDGSGRSFASSYTGQPGSPSPGFHHAAGSLQGLHNLHGSYNVGNMQGSLSSRNSSMNSLPSPGVQQANGSFSSGRFSSNNLPVALAQLSHGNSHGHSGIPNRGGINNVGNPGYSSNANGVGGSIPGILSTSAGLSGRNSVSNIGMSHLLANAGPRITSAMGNMVGGVNLGRTISSGGLSMPGLSSRLNMAANSGSGLNVQGQNRMLGGGLPQGSQVMSMLGNSYHAGGGQLSQNHVNNMMLSDHSNDSSLFDINNDFPQLTSRPGSASGSQGQLGSLRKQGLGVPIVQQHQEFSIQNEDFPALPGYKGAGLLSSSLEIFAGGSSDYPMDLHQKEQLHDNAMSMMHSQSFSIPRSGGFNLGGTYPSHRTQQQPQHTSSGGLQGLGLRPLNSPNSVSGNGYDQLIQQYQQQQNQPQFPVQQMSSINQFRDSEIKSEADPFCLLGLLDVLNGTKPDLTSLALGIDLTTLGLDLNSTGKLYKTFASPWTNEPAKTEVEFTVPSCYYATPPPPLTRASFKRFSFELLFYTFYSMPKDEAQLYAADELYERGWFYHKEHKLWFFRVGEPMVRTALYERGTYECLDPNSFKTVRKEHCIVQYEHIEKRPSLLQH
ncbi:probable NOT transcription complex subunit VIP2 isoform X1 [Brassica napus]|uniref:probable NOT transcription complex subunit VIP2 isoform X1 n=1 Tax=Brassica napus TaxID=3708 RepID=UPI00207861EE|nr:probable NOT transcription complex subunit VIP2 isoform X1 [Brassica napus]XP_013738373.2 probable NOT transcription complex subunit VIP2 isoform X1 [Brassica napus]